MTFGDITCASCGEPWGEYAMRHNVGDWDDQPDDAWKKFASGEGCPNCDWGSQGEGQREYKVKHKKDLLKETDEDIFKYF